MIETKRAAIACTSATPKLPIPFTSSKGNLSINSIHPEVSSNLSSQGGAESSNDSQSGSKDGLFASSALNCAKTLKLNVRGDRTINVRQYRPCSALTNNDTQSNYSRSDVNSNDDTPVVLFFIHGVGGSWKIWESQIHNFILEGYEIIAFDLLGHGSSTSPRDASAYEFVELAHDVLFVFDTFRKRRNVLIGHSYGTSFCILLSNERGSWVSKMVLVSGGGPTTLVPDRCSVFCLPTPIFSLLQPILVRVFRWRAYDGKTSSSIRNKVTAFSVPSHVLKAIMQGQHWSECNEQYHEDITVPALLIYGSGDKFVPISEEIRMSETIYSARLKVIENAGHMVMIEAPAEVNRAIQDFLDLDSSTRTRRSKLGVPGTSNGVLLSQQGMSSSDAPMTSQAMTSSGVDIHSVGSSQDGSLRQRCGSKMSRPRTADKSRGKKMF